MIEQENQALRDFGSANPIFRFHRCREVPAKQCHQINVGARLAARFGLEEEVEGQGDAMSRTHRSNFVPAISVVSDEDEVVRFAEEEALNSPVVDDEFTACVSGGQADYQAGEHRVVLLGILMREEELALAVDEQRVQLGTPSGPGADAHGPIQSLECLRQDAASEQVRRVHKQICGQDAAEPEGNVAGSQQSTAKVEMQSYNAVMLGKSTTMTDDPRVAALSAAVNLIPDDHFTDYGGGWANEIGTALIDAVFSIRSRYRASSPTAGVIGRVRSFRNEESDAKDDLVVLRDLGSNRIRELMGSTVTGGRPKSVAVVDAADAFAENGIVHAEDFLVADTAAMKRVYTGVHGLGWVTFEYFTMLLGLPGVKADTMITRYVNRVLAGANLQQGSNYEAREIAISAYNDSQRGATLTHFEHAIWKFESDLGSKTPR